MNTFYVALTGEATLNDITHAITASWSLGAGWEVTTERTDAAGQSIGFSTNHVFDDALMDSIDAQEDRGAAVGRNVDTGEEVTDG